MTSRRIASAQKTVPDKDDVDDAPVRTAPTASTKFTVADVPGSVITKLLFFTMSMIIAPLGSYYVSLNFLFKGNSTAAGALAAIIANVVLIGYVIVAMKEDDSEPVKEKKSQ